MLPRDSLFWDGGARVPTKDWTWASVRYPRARLALAGDVLSLALHPKWLGPLSRRRARDATIRLTPVDGAVLYLVKGWWPLDHGVGIGRLGHRTAYFWRWRGRHDILRAAQDAGFEVSWTERRAGYLRDSERMTNPLPGQDR